MRKYTNHISNKMNLESLDVEPTVYDSSIKWKLSTSINMAFHYLGDRNMG